MSSFLTVEDVNTVIAKYGLRELWEKVDTSLIDVSGDFSDVLYDFVKVSRTASGGSYTFTFEVVNSAWTGGCYFTQTDGTFINEIGSHSNKVITFTTSYENVCLFLRCSVLDSTFLFKKYYIKLIDSYPGVRCDTIPSYMTLDKFNQEYRFCYISLLNNTQGSIVETVNSPGVFNIAYVEEMDYYFVARLEKTEFQFECTQDLLLGQVNTVALGTDSKYKPNGSLIGANTPTIKVIYNDEIISASWDSTLNDYTFELDLTDKVTPSKVKFTVLVERNDVLNYSETIVRLDADYQTFASISELTTAITDGAKLLRMNIDELQFTDNLELTDDLTILGDTGSLYLEENSIIVGEDVTLKMSNLSICYGDNSIIQSNGSKVKLTDVTFSNCTGSNYNNLGSVIYCNSTNEEDTFITELVGCEFYNCHNIIFHQGDLTVENCKYHNDSYIYLDVNNPAFLYQSRGNAVINGSVFDIDYGTDEVESCDTDTKIGFAQSLIMIGENATINGAGHNDLQANDKLPFFNDANYNNQSHVFCQYYHSGVSECVFTSPLTGFEDRCVCYSVTGVDWIFKSNAQVTRHSWGSENRNRKIIWE